MELKRGYRVSFCIKNGVLVAEVYLGASKRFLGELKHPQDLVRCDRNIEAFIQIKAREYGLIAERNLRSGCEFYLK